MKILTIILLLLINIPLYSGESEHHSNNHFAIFTGATTSFDKETTDFSLGADYEFRLPFWHGLTGIGLFAEAVFGEHTAILGGVPIFIHPYKGFKILFAPGFETFEAAKETDGTTHIWNKKKDKIQSETGEGELERHYEFLMRFGIGYDFHVGIFSLSPTVNADLIHGHWYLVYGFGIGIGF